MISVSVRIALNINGCYNFIVNLHILLIYCLGIQQTAAGAE